MNAKEIYHLARRNGTPFLPRRPINLPDVHYMINARARYRAILDRCVEDGKIGICRSGMDCDCTSYTHEFVAEAPDGAISFEKNEREHAEWLDGPETTRFMKPSEVVPYSNSIDLALEAYEDGHISTVYYRRA